MGIAKSWFTERLIVPLWRYYAQEAGRRPVRFELSESFNIGKACLLVCLGELRHYKDKLKTVHPEFWELLRVNSLRPYLEVCSREVLYEEIIKSELLDIIPERLVHTCVVGFLGEWSTNYGGLRWYMIAKAIRDIFRSPSKKKLESLLFRSHNFTYFLEKVDKIFSSHSKYYLCYIILTAGREWPEFFHKYNLDDVIKFNFSRSDVKTIFSFPFRGTNYTRVAKVDEKYYWKSPIFRGKGERR